MNDKGKYWDEPWNVVIGCTKCSPGCLNCWAETMASRFSTKELYNRVIYNGKWNNNIFCDKSVLDKPLHWRKPRTVFVNNMSDTFHPAVPFEFILKIWEVACKCGGRDLGHNFLFLTKRPERMLKFTQWMAGEDDISIAEWPRNCALGVTVCNQTEADEKIPILLQIPAAHRWLSIEPMLEPIKTNKQLDHRHTLALLNRIDWVVIGCESGPNRRPCELDWMIDLAEQCKAAGVRVHVKQVNINGRVSHAMCEWPEKLRVREKIRM